jgi:DNA-directed RNA polymerase subunit RPC12/RpoP
VGLPNTLGEPIGMPRTRHEPDDDEDDEDDGYEPDGWDDDAYDPDDPETYPSGMYDDPELPTVECPYCRAEILEDAEQCLRCGKYISREDAPASRSGVWWVLILLALLAALIMTVG